MKGLNTDIKRQVEEREPVESTGKQQRERQEECRRGETRGDSGPDVEITAEPCSLNLVAEWSLWASREVVAA